MADDVLESPIKETVGFQGLQKLKAEVHRIFELITDGEYEPYTALYAIREIYNEKDRGKRERIAALMG
jgi:hypothetical protein